MRLPILLACALTLVAVPVAADTVSDTVPVTCGADVNQDNVYGVGCGLQATCYPAEWGYHSDFLTVGGSNSCSAGVWTDPGAQPEEPLDPLGPLTGLSPPVSCRAAVDQEGVSGAGCGAHLTCTQALWGYHSDFLTVGGNNGCSAGVWANPDADPSVRDLLGPITDNVVVCLPEC